MELPKEYRFSEEHEWAKPESGTVRVGITEYAQKELGDVVFVDLPKPGTAVKKGKSFATVESVKAVSDIYAPADGVIKLVNDKLSDSPQLVNESPYTDGWMVVIETGDDLAGLLDSVSYASHITEISK